MFSLASEKNHSCHKWERIKLYYRENILMAVKERIAE
jgi:hypothetical protein